MQALQEELVDVARVLHYKEKRLSQAEASRNYRTCEQLTEEMMALKSKKCELEAEKYLLERKQRRAESRKMRLRPSASESSDMDGSTSSRSAKSRSVTPAASPFPSRRSSFSAQDSEEGPSPLSSSVSTGDIDGLAIPANEARAATSACTAVSPLPHSSSVSSIGDQEGGPSHLSSSSQGSHITCSVLPVSPDALATPCSFSVDTDSIFW